MVTLWKVFFFHARKKAGRKRIHKELMFLLKMIPDKRRDIRDLILDLKANIL
jgi:hypothetical protein